MKNSTKILSFCFIALYALFSGNVFGQGEVNVWQFGSNAGLDFNTTPPTMLEVNNMSAASAEGEGYASICDASGNLLFYTDGTKIYDRTYSVMTGGGSLNGDLSAEQSSIIVPRPGSTTLYYVFTVGRTGTTTGIYYNVVDMSSGNGSVTTANTPLWTGVRTMEALCVVPTGPTATHTGYWLLCHADLTNQFRAYRISSTGVNATSVNTSIGYTPNNGQGMIKSNGCYNKIAISYGGQGTGLGNVQLLNFNFNTGVFSNPQTINGYTGSFGPYGLEFSKLGDYLYVTELMKARLHRYDITSGVGATITGTDVIIGTSPHGTNPDDGVQAFPRMGHVQMGPDGKLYVANHNAWNAYSPGSCANCGSSNILSTVTNPDGPVSSGPVVDRVTWTGTAYSFPNGWPNNGAGVTHGLPTLLTSFLAGNLDFGDDLVTVGPDKIVCKGSPTTFNFNFSGTVSTTATHPITWDFGDGSPVSYATSPSHTYNPATTPTTYTVTLTVIDKCDIEYEQKRTVRVDELITAGNVSCSNPSITLNGTGAGAANYVWYDAVGGAPIGYGASVNKTYTPASSTPSTFYAFDATPSAGPYTAGNAATANNWSSGTLVTSFVLEYRSIIRSIQVKGANASSAVTFSIKQGATTVATLPAIASITSGQVVTLNFNAILPAGSYTVEASNGSFEWSGNTGNSRDVAGVIRVTGDGAGNSGPFYNIVLAIVSPCANNTTITRSCSLPVTWLDFNAKREGESSAVKVEWSTATEQNSKVFNVQRSLDGLTFETIGQVNAAGNSVTVRHYEYLDNNAPIGRLYYRLVEEDADGASMISKIVFVNGIGSLSLSLVPNPGDGSFTIVGLSGDVKLNVAVYSITGQSIFATAAYPGEVINLEGVAKGFYIVKIVSGNTEQSIRYINQ